MIRRAASRAPAGLALIAVLAATGCTASPSGPAVSSAGPASSARPASSAASIDDSRQAFGTDYAWPSGVRVKVTKPVNHRLNRWAATLGAKAGLRFRVTVVNGTTVPLDWSAFGLRASSAGAPARMLYEVNLGIRGLPKGSLAADKSLTFDLAYGVKDPRRFLVEVQPRPDDPTVQFHS